MMPDLDRTDRLIATLLREEAELAERVVPPPLAELRTRATARRRRRMTLAGLGIAAAAAAGVMVWNALPGGGTAYVAPADGPIVDTFPVPTYDWDGGAGMEALVSGTLWFTEQGCTVMTGGEGTPAEAVFFPNATGVTYDNGVRAVVDSDGRVFAVEGQSFEYGGGWVEPSAEARASWDALCPDEPFREAAIVNDHPAHDPLTEAPPPPTAPGPTAPATDEELGFYEVPSHDWDPTMDADQALIEGTVSFTPEGCPVIESAVDGEPHVTGLVFPNAEGFSGERDGGEPRVISTFDNGTEGVIAMEGEEISYAGGHAPGDDPRWTSVCDTVVDDIFIVQEYPFGDYP